MSKRKSTAFPDAVLQDLKRSGLTASDAAKLAIQYMEPSGWSRFASYKIPYFHLDGTPNEFHRVRYVGDVVALPACDVIDTDLSIEDGISLILSAGASVPATLAEKKATDPRTAG